MFPFQLFDPYHLGDEVYFFFLEQVFVFSLGIFDDQANGADPRVVERMRESNLDRFVFGSRSDPLQADDEVQEVFVRGGLVCKQLALVDILLDGLLGIVDESFDGLFDLRSFDKWHLGRKHLVFFFWLFLLSRRRLCRRRRRVCRLDFFGFFC